ncbi:iron ABC transporter permease [Actinoplanes sp. L3-i22]|nr:iron ABC transporter permease [Actinoplanes sp. L3-i22]
MAVLVAVTAASIAYGSTSIPLRTVAAAFRHFDPTVDAHLVVRTLRLPRTVVGLVVGLALGLAGAIMQGLTRNPIADPGILGVNAGAALAVVIGIHVLGVSDVHGYVWFAFLGALAASVLVYGVGSMGRDGASPVKLAIAGAAVTSLLASATTCVLLLDRVTMDQYRFWVVGSLAGRGGSVVGALLPFLATGTILALWAGRSLNTLALGDDVARGLGQRLGRARALCAAAVVLLVGAATAAAGPIGFVGLTVPHVARAIVGADHRWILAYSAVLAPILLLSADILGRAVARPSELQVGIVTAVIGAPVFVALVRRRRLAQL